jgi:hypothetical protein
MSISAGVGDSSTVSISVCDGEWDTMLVSDPGCDVSVDDSPVGVVS